MKHFAPYALEHKKIDYLFDALSNGLIGLFGLYIFVGLTYYSRVDTFVLFGWIGVNLLITSARIGLLLSYKKATITEENIGKYYTLFTLLAALSAMAWGSSAFFIFPLSGEYQVVLLLLTSGVMSAAVLTFASKANSFYIYIFFVITPYLYILATSEIPLHHTFNYIMLFFVLMIFAISKKISKNVEDNILFEYENGALVTKLKEKVIDADSANRAKSEFLSVMSHEIRTPLNAIIGFVKILKEKESDAQKQSYLDTIDKSSNILINVINDILDITKIETNKLTLESTSFDPQEEFRSLFMLFEESAKLKKIRLVNEISKSLPPQLESDILRIKQIISNLLSNAIKFTPEGGEVRVIILFDGARESLKVSVKDSGIGIASEDIEKITDSFTQADSSIARKYGGTGLGLSIVTAILNLLASKLEIESRVGEGSCFSFVLPVKVVAPVQQEESGEKEAVRFANRRVLVAEDNKTNQMLIEILLDDMELDVVMVDDGAEALQAVKESSFDILLMDINMPNMNGIEAMEAIHSYEKEHQKSALPIVALTANAVSGDRENYLALGFDDYVAKPIDVAALEEVLARHLS